MFALLVLGACNNNSQPSASQTDTTTTSDTSIVSIQIPKSACYMHVTGQDTFHLKVEVFPNVVTGNLRYLFSQKDRSQGDLEGKLSGDTLFADYTFMSEGTRSVRQVAFLLKDSIAVEGYGEVEEKDGKMVFKQPSNIDFSKGTTYREVSCIEYDPANTGGQASTNISAGSESLYQYQWNLVELEGKAIDTAGGKSPNILFYPGQGGSVAGSTGCNRLKGTFTLSANNMIKLSPLATTRMACIGENIETPFLNVLSQVDSWRIENNELMLNKGDTLLAKFKGVNAKS